MAAVTKQASLQEAIEAYVRFHPHWKATRHMRARMANFWKYFPEYKRIGEIERDDINRWIHHLLDERGFSPNYVRLLVKTMNHFYRWLCNDEIIERNPFKQHNLYLPPKVKFEREPFTYEEYRRALAEGNRSLVRVESGGSCCANYVPGAIRIGFFTGLRLGDVASMAWVPQEFGNWVDLDADCIIAHPIKMRRFRQRITIPLDPELKVWLVEAANDKDHDIWILPDMRLTMMYDPQQVSRALRMVFRRAGLERQTFHGFRHGFVTRLVNHGIDPIIVGQMTGQSIETIAHYAHVTMEAKRRALAAMRAGEISVTKLL